VKKFFAPDSQVGKGHGQREDAKGKPVVLGVRAVFVVRVDFVMIIEREDFILPIRS
jgi:hypothetical protein